MPVMSFKFNTTDQVSSTPEFVSSVCWQGQSTTLIAANSSGNIKILEMVQKLIVEMYQNYLLSLQFCVLELVNIDLTCRYLLSLSVILYQTCLHRFSSLKIVRWSFSMEPTFQTNKKTKIRQINPTFPAMINKKHLPFYRLRILTGWTLQNYESLQ